LLDKCIGDYALIEKSNAPNSDCGTDAIARSLDSMGKDRIRSHVTRCCCLIKVKDESFNRLDRTMKFERLRLLNSWRTKVIRDMW
jgi:hypothetical protein